MSYRVQDELEKVKQRIHHLSLKTVSNGCTESEALAAAETIGKMLTTYNLTLDEVTLSDEPCITRYFEYNRKRSHPVNFCILAIADFCDCISWFSLDSQHHEGSAAGFFGIESDVEMALYLTDHLKKAIDSETKKYKQSEDYLYNSIDGGHRRSKTVNFQKGMANRLSIRIYAMARNKESHFKEQDLNGTEIIHLKTEKIKEEFKKTGIKLRKNSYKDVIGNYSAFSSGEKAGQKVNLNRPFPSNTSPKGFLE